MSGIMNMFVATKTTIATAVDAFFNSVSLLLNTSSTNGAQNNTFLDSSTNNFTITRNGNTTQGTFTPFSQTGWSNYFNGTVTTSYLNAVSNAVFDFGTGDFTLEAFIYVPAYPTSGTVAGIIIAAHNWNGSGMNFIFRIGQTGLLYFENSAGNSLTASTAVALNTWAHVACVRSSGTVTFYINGTSAGSGAAAGSISSTTAVSIGNALSGGTFGNFNGYISNARITKGGALYTSTFTPSTTPLTTTVSAGTVSLLTCQSNRYVDNSVNNFTLTSGTTNSVQAFSPFLPTAAYDTSVVGGSGYFDGNGDALVIASNAAFAFGTGDFIIEFWLYPTTASGQRNITFPTVGAPISYMNTSRQLVFETFGAPPSINTTNTLDLNAWNHCVASRVSGTTKLFINGVEGVSSTAFLATNFVQSSLNIGTDNGSNYTNGYISGVRIVKGSGVTSVTLPTAPPTAITNTQFLANFTNAGIYDSAAKNVLETVGNAQVSTTQAKWGTTSMAFNGSSDYLKAPFGDIDFFLGGGNWTIEAWVYLNSTSGTQGLIFGQSDFANATNASYEIYVTGGNASFYNGSSNTTITVPSVSATTWTHLAWVRNGNTITSYVNGTSSATGSITAAINNGTTNPATIGAKATGANYLNGYLDDFRITKYARYTANFTPPTTAFPIQ